ncbi:MAG TPA: C39 family peptidase [Eggerthellaceae bacterium]|uniref:C39 family peptidase n=1 Tax=Gordonibacter pamelaeae TaxID=471189 RepID=UPI00210DC8D7|nr:C39 family peptidase [Gordonibacter pamelaeae]MCQ4849098.1 C39 family peptidase [Gordonibacter pamelaeae]HJH74016.1 C39 family peptidase [Eggerthellaceae bacterium]
MARAGNVLARCKAALACFGAAALVLALALALPLAASPSAAADVDLEARAAAEAAQLQVAAELPRSASLDVPALQQYPELPTGCESVALTNALLACGFDLQKTEIAQEWLPTGADDFVHAFMGDPTSPDGHSCMAPAIADTAAAYLAAHGSDLEAADLTGAPFRDVLAQAAAGNPVVVWCTIGLDEPGACYRTAQEGGRTYNPITNSHCVVVRGFDLDAGTVLVSDSLAGQVSYPLATFAARYYALGAQAVVLR